MPPCGSKKARCGEDSQRVSTISWQRRILAAAFRLWLAAYGGRGYGSKRSVQ